MLLFFVPPLLLTFFVSSHPLYVFDTDDWHYLQDTRFGSAWPVWKLWNPTKVFPEIFMPIVASLSTFILSPLYEHDYLQSLSVGFAITLTLSIVICAYFLGKFLKKRFCLNELANLFLVAFFIVLFFCPLYKTGFFHVNNSTDIRYFYLLNSNDITCVFNYIIPAFINGAIIFYLITRDFHNGNINAYDRQVSNYVAVDKYLAFSLLVIFIYFGLNSNLFQGIMLASYGSSCIILSLVFNWFYKGEKRLTLLKQSLKDNYLYILILIFWCIVLVYEANGERASVSGNGNSLLDLNLKKAFNTFKFQFKLLNLIFELFLILNLLTVFYSVYRFIRIKSQTGYQNFKNSEDFQYWCLSIKFLLSFIVTSFFLIMLCAKVDINYLHRTDVFISCMFFSIGYTVITIAYLCKKFRPLFAVVFLMVVIVFSYTLCYPIKSKDSTYANFSIRTVKKDRG